MVRSLMQLKLIKVLRNLMYIEKIISKSLYYQYTFNFNHIIHCWHKLYESRANQEHDHVN